MVIAEWADCASYGDKLLDRLADPLSELGVQTCDKRRLYQYLRFLNTYHQIVRSLSAQSQSALLSESARPIPERERSAPADDNPPIGIVLCTERDHSIVEYALAGTDNSLFVSKFQLQLASVIDGVLTLQPLIIGDILVDFPFNAQVSALRVGACVETVDKFQGQEAPIVIYSITRSSAEEAPRGVTFFIVAIAGTRRQVVRCAQQFSVATQTS